MTFLSQNDHNSIYRYIVYVMLYLILSALISINVYIVNWQNVILRHHANVHGGSSDLLAKLLD